jgi:hypothetical protein
MKTPRKWWNDPNYPPSVWTAIDQEAARRAGIRPKPRGIDVSVSGIPDRRPEHLAPTWSPLAKPDRSGERRAHIDRLLAKLGVR